MSATATQQPLEESFRGQILRSRDEGYEEARRVFNAMVDRRPSLIARCTGVADVVAAVRHARAHDLPIAVRGGGHGVMGYATCDDGIVIDLSPMKGMRVDPGARTARAQAGLTWGEFDHETQVFGLATTGGRVSSTGIGGLTLGSGSGWLERRHGLTCDNLLSADVVTAEGEVVVASEDENEDLFWGLHGAGGNFGIVTSFEYRLHPVGPVVLGGMLLWERDDRAAEVLRGYREVLAEAPDDFGSAFAFLTAPPEPFVPDGLRGRPALGAIVCHVGDLQAGEEIVERLRGIAPPAVDLVQPMPYTVAQTLLDAGNPPGLQQYWKAEAVQELGDDAVDALVQQTTDVPSPMSLLVLEPGGRAIARVGEDETPISGRDADYRYYVFSMWPDPADADANVGWARSVAEAMEPFTARGIQFNFMSDVGDERVRRTFGAEKYDRLVALKDRWDPDNVFRINQNIRPGTGRAEAAAPAG